MSKCKLLTLHIIMISQKRKNTQDPGKNFRSDQ